MVSIATKNLHLNNKQMEMFELLEHQDINYSNFVEFFDNIPKWVDFGKNRYWSYDDHLTSISNEFKFKHEGVEKLFIVTIKPGRVTRKIKCGNVTTDKDVLIYPSIQREEAVYDALRKLAHSGQGGFYGNDLGTKFTLRKLRQELIKFKKTLSIPEIKESLRVLRSAEIHITEINSGIEWSPSYLSNLVLTTRDQYDKGGEQKCLAIFDTLVSTGVKAVDFREFNYAIAQNTKNPIAKYLIKRMDRNYKQAGECKPYTIKLSTIFKAIYRQTDKKMSNNTRHMNNAIKEMKEKLRIVNCEIEVIKCHWDKNKTVDVKYSFYPHSSLIDDVKRFHAKYNANQKRAKIYNLT